MSDWYCDPSKTLAAYLDYAATPTAAGTVPTKGEDGNGKGTGTASMATLVITFTGIPAADGTITIGGVTFTAKASGATGNQFNAVTSATQCATNLAAAINASTTNIVNPTPAIATAPLRNMVNATASGGVVTVYTRICGSEWNSVTENSTLTNCSITAQWSGGTDGAWGYWANVAGAISWPTSVALGQYGALPGCYLGALSAGDVVHIRTARGGSNVKITMANSSFNTVAQAIGTMAAPLTYLADNGIKWSGDAGVFTVSADGSQQQNRNFRGPTTNGVWQVWRGVNLTDTTRNWRWEFTGANVAASFNTTIQTNIGTSAPLSQLRLMSMEVTGLDGAALNNANNANCYCGFSPAGAAGLPRSHPSMVCVDLYIKSAALRSPFKMTDGTYAGYLRLENCVVDATGITSAATDAILAVTGGASGVFEAYNSKWINYNAASHQSGFQTILAATGKSLTVTMRDCEYTNIKVYGGASHGGVVGRSESNTTGLEALLASISIVSQKGSRHFVSENLRRLFGWVDSAQPKTTSSLLPDGTTPFSVRTAVTTASGAVTKYHPIVFPPMQKINSLANGTRTAKLLLLVDGNYRTALGSRDPKNDEMWIDVTYVDTSGNLKKVSSQCAFGATPASLTAGNSGDWSTTSYDVWGVTHTFYPFEITVSCPDMASGTEARLEFVNAVQTSSVDDCVFLDPEWGLT